MVDVSMQGRLSLLLHSHLDFSIFWKLYPISAETFWKCQTELRRKHCVAIEVAERSERRGCSKQRCNIVIAESNALKGAGIFVAGKHFLHRDVYQLKAHPLFFFSSTVLNVIIAYAKL